MDEVSNAAAWCHHSLLSRVAIACGIQSSLLSLAVEFVGKKAAGHGGAYLAGIPLHGSPSIPKQTSYPIKDHFHPLEGERGEWDGGGIVVVEK